MIRVEAGSHVEGPAVCVARDHAALEVALVERVPRVGARVLHGVDGVADPVEPDADPVDFDAQTATGRDLAQSRDGSEGQKGSSSCAVRIRLSQKWRTALVLVQGTGTNAAGCLSSCRTTTRGSVDWYCRVEPNPFGSVRGEGRGARGARRTLGRDDAGVELVGGQRVRAAHRARTRHALESSIGCVRERELELLVEVELRAQGEVARCAGGVAAWGLREGDTRQTDGEQYAEKDT